MAVANERFAQVHVLLLFRCKMEHSLHLFHDSVVHALGLVAGQSVEVDVLRRRIDRRLGRERRVRRDGRDLGRRRRLVHGHSGTVMSQC